MSPYEIRVIGDPVLTQRAREVTDIDGSIVKLVDAMLTTMYAAPGLGLAAPQVGIKKQIFVWDLQDGRGGQAIVNPKIVESDGVWVYEEGCLSVPGLTWEIERPNQVHVTGRDLDGNEVSFEVCELAGRLFQHELDHLNGVLLTEHLDDDQRREATAALTHLRAQSAARRGPDLLSLQG